MVGSLPFDVKDLRPEGLFNVKAWVALVTGGGTGLGFITASALASNGARVYITGRRLSILKDAVERYNTSLASLSEEERAAAGNIIPIECDVMKKESIEHLAKQVVEKEGYLNLLVNNAGIGGVKNSFRDAPLTPESVSAALMSSELKVWEDVMLLNSAAVYYMTVAFVPLLVKAKDQFGATGSVINVASMSGMTKQSQGGQFAYNAAKAAMISLSQQLAYEFRIPELAIRVNTISPGYFPSEMTPHQLFSGPPEELRAKKGIPMGRQGTAREYAMAVFNFAKNGYVTGANLLIDGGWLLEQS